MNSTEKALICLIRGSLFDTPQEYPVDIDWNEVYHEAQNQAVCGLINEKEFGREDPQWVIYRYHTAANCIQILHAQKDLVKLLSDHGISSAILKGSAASIYYPQPCYRTMGDIDIIVPQNQFSFASKLMEENGYIVTHKEEDANARHIGYSKDGKAYELHHHFSHKGTDIEDYIIKGLEHTVEVSINGIGFPMLPPLANGLVLLDHMKSHLQSGMGLRQVIDWMMYVEKELDDDMWEKKFKQAAESVNLDTLAKTITRMCQMYLGLNGEIAWCNDVDDNLCKRLMDIIMMSGNFGIKQGKGFQVETVSTSIRKEGLFHYLQYAGEYNWKAYKRHRWLKPFCWLYQVFRYGKQGVLARRGDKLFSDLSRSKERFEVLKQLNLV